MTAILCSCSALESAFPNINLADKQEHSSTSTNSGQGAGRDIKAKVGLVNGQDKSSNFDNSNVKQTNTSTDNKIESGQGKTQAVLGNLSDNSKNTTQTNSSTKNNSNNSVVNNFSLSYLIVIVLSLVLSCLAVGVIFGKLIPTKQQKQTYNLLLKKFLE